jgi:hypothetical protein
MSNSSEVNPAAENRFMVIIRLTVLFQTAQEQAGNDVDPKAVRAVTDFNLLR